MPIVIIYFIKNTHFNTLDISNIVTLKIVFGLLVGFYVTFFIKNLCSKKLMLIGQSLRIISFIFIFFDSYGAVLFLIVYTIGSIIYRPASKAYLSLISDNFKNSIYLRIKIQNIATILGPCLVMADQLKFNLWLFYLLLFFSVITLFNISRMDMPIKKMTIKENLSSIPIKENKKFIIFALVSSFIFYFSIFQLDYFIPTALELIGEGKNILLFYIINGLFIVLLQNYIIAIFNKLKMDMKFLILMPIISMILLIYFINSQILIFFYFFIMMMSISEIIVASEIDMIINYFSKNKVKIFFMINVITSFFVIVTNSMLGFLFDKNQHTYQAIIIILPLLICYLVFLKINKQELIKIKK